MTTANLIQEVVQSWPNAKYSFGDCTGYDLHMLPAYCRTVNAVRAEFAGVLTGRIIEFGAFTAVVSVALRRLGFVVVASDIDLIMQDQLIAEKMAAEDIVPASHNLANLPLPFETNEFDCVVFAEVVEHICGNPLPLIRELCRILKPGGTLYCATPNIARFSNRIGLLRGRTVHAPIKQLEMSLDPTKAASVGIHWREYSKADLEELFRRAGATMRKHSYFRVVPVQGMLPRRLFLAGVYKICPDLLSHQSAVFQKEVALQVSTNGRQNGAGSD